MRRRRYAVECRLGPVTIGPLALPFGLLALLSALLIGLAAGKLAGRARQVEVEPLLWSVALVGLITARLAFVYLYQDKYLATPWSMFDIRDGGFFGPAGLLAVTVATAWLAWRNKDRRVPLLYAVGAGVVVWVASVLLALAMPAQRMQVPQITLSDMRGRSIELKGFAGKPLVINLWASWCPPCRREMPVLGAAQLQHPEIHFVFANQGEAPETIRNYVSGQKFNLENVLLDSGRQLGAILGSGALPTTLFFDAQGVLVEQRMGELSAATLAQRLESLQHAR